MLYALFAIVAWLAFGHAVLGGLFWALLQVPESNVFMVALSALLAILLLVVAAWVEVFALLSWAPSEAPAVRIRRTVRAVPAFLVSLALFGIVFWISARAGDWLSAHRGEMDAWLIVHLRLVKSGPIHAALAWLLWFVRYGLGLSLALALLADLVTSGFRSIARPSWLRAGLRPRRFALVALWMLVFVWLPWQAVYWRPKSLPPTWLEPAFVAVKLLVIYLLANVGWALVLRTTSTHRTSSHRRPAAICAL
jgi:hypothetical protein